MSRKMWQRVWSGTPRPMVPITSVTNGIHVPSFVAPEMRNLLDTYLGADWREDLLNPDLWKRVRGIPDQTLWETKCGLRQQLVAFVRDQLAMHWVPGPDNDLPREEVVSRLRGSSLTIGFARRFAPYKRAHLLFSDLERLERIVSNPRRPIQFLFAGKAHPKDAQGCDLVRQVVTLCRQKRFAGRIVFLENYDLALAKRLVCGVDVWLNTPRRPYEASGTSGQKVAINGGINLSVADGWWCEVTNDDAGWTIGPEASDVDEDTVSNDRQDAADLYSLLEDIIVPLFYQRNSKGIPEGWLEYLRGSMMSVVPQFNTDRMLIDYFNTLYKPCAERARDVTAGNAKLARASAEWKRQVAGKFSSLHLLDITMAGLTDGVIQVGRAFQVAVRIDLGEVDPADVRVELVVGRADPKQQVRDPVMRPMASSGKPQEHVLTFTAEFTAQEKGNYVYGIRIHPSHEPYGSTDDMGLTIWA
jgi:phosphorylase/glycogen(starch) synthase